ncbi:MAG: lysophospholipid acyltransferase family protein [Myxococcota bacterium]
MFVHIATVVVSLWLRMLVGKTNAKVENEHIVWFWKGLLRMSRTRLHVKRASRFPIGKMCVYMSNHLSHMDIPVVFATIQDPVRMVLKQELMQFPLFGPVLSHLGFVAIDRQNPVQGFKQLQQAQQSVTQGIPIWIAPEGSRSRTNQLARMRRGGFHLAIQLGVPIVPIWIDGTQRILPPGGRAVCYDQTVTTYVGDPIETRGLQPDRAGIAQLMEQFRARLMQLKLRKGISSQGLHEQQPSTRS